MESINLDRVIAGAAWYIPEIILCIIAVVIIILSLFKSGQAGIFYVVIGGILLNVLFLNTQTVHYSLRFIMAVAALTTILISGRDQRMEYYLFIISILLGAEILVKAKDFITIILSMEMISLSSYVLTAGTTPDRSRAEAAWKFFIYGSIATAVMIFGMTYLFGINGSIGVPRVIENSAIQIVGGLMMLSGFFFKMTAAPFHLWAPDVYEATPAPIVVFLSIVPKLAAFGFLLTTFAESNSATAMISILAIVVGTLAALNQANAKRMMAYSSVAQAGFLLAIIASGAGNEVAIYYALVFILMNFAVFTVIHLQEQSGNGTAMKDFAGFGYTNVLPAVAITLGLISLVGLPPMGGFMAKLFVFKAIWQKFSNTQDLVFLVLFIVGLLATAASLYFYLKIPFYAFFRRSEEKQTIKIPLFTNLLLLILVGLLLVLFLAPGLLMG